MFKLIVSNGRVADRTAFTRIGALKAASALEAKYGVAPLCIGDGSCEPAADDWTVSLPAGREQIDSLHRAVACAVEEQQLTVVINGTPTTITGSQKLDYTITDGKGNLIIEPGFNIANSNPRLDDPVNGIRLLATSGDSPGDVDNPAVIAGNRAGGFLAGTALPTTTGNRIRVRFEKTGRYLVICMNRAHSLNDHMFGFVSVVGDDDDDQ